MPTIPKYTRPTQIPSSQGSRIPLSVAGNIGGALANLGSVMAAHGERQAKIQDELDKIQALNDAQLVVNDTALDLGTALSDLKGKGLTATEYRAQGDQLINEYYDRMNDNDSRLKAIIRPEARLYAAQKLGMLRLQQTQNLHNDYNERALSEGKASALLEVDKLERRAINAGSEEESQSILAEAQTFLTTHGGLGFSPAESANQMLKSAARVRVERFFSTVRTDPEQALEILGDPSKTSALGLTQDQIISSQNHARNEINHTYTQGERRRTAEDREVTQSRELMTNAAVRQIVSGKDLTIDLAQGDLGKSLSTAQVENLVNFQRQYRSGREEHSDPEALLRMRVAARTGRDPLTGEVVRVNDLLNAPEISAARRGELVIGYLDQQDARRGKAETLRDKLVKKGEQSIRSVLGEVDEFGRIMDQSSRIDVYEALQEYDALLSTAGKKQDPRDIAEQIITKRLSRKTSTVTKGDAYRSADGVLDRDALAEDVLSGKLSRIEANAILRGSGAPRRPRRTDEEQVPERVPDERPSRGGGVIREPARKRELINR